jgi:uncharacterized protein (DUF433 family)
MDNVISAFNLEQASRLAGLTTATLISWDKDDFFRPSLAYDNRRSPYSRIYNFEDLVALRTLSILRERVSMQHLKKAAEKLKEHAGKPWTSLALYTLNREVHFRNPGTGLIEGAVSGQYGATIPLEAVAEEMRQKANELRERDRSKIGQLERHRFVMGNAWVFAGTRIPVADVLSLLDAGFSREGVLDEYPDLVDADIEAAKALADSLTRAA